MRSVLVALVAAVLALARPVAQLRVVPLDMEGGHVALGLALRHLANTGIFMMATAHPDDENNALLVMLNRGLGFRTALVTATRGNGGQNEIGPELFEPLGVLRTEELAAIHRFDGAEQYFTRAVDFGFSFSIDETFEKWGREAIISDFVRLIRTIRPDVVTALPPTGAGGGQHHQASSVLAREAFRAAGDAAKFPEQLSDGLRPWRARKFYVAGGFGGPEAPPPPGATRIAIDLSRYDQLLGRTYAEIGVEARSMHKCQGTAQLLALPGPATASYDLVDSTIAAQQDESALFGGVDSSIEGLVRFAGAQPSTGLVRGLAEIAAAARDAQRRFDSDGDEATFEPLLTGLRAERRLRAALQTLVADEGARFELDFRLQQKESEFQKSIELANGLVLDALADDGVIVPGQAVRVSLVMANRGKVQVEVGATRFQGFAGSAACNLTPVTQIQFERRRVAVPSESTKPVSQLGAGQALRCEAALQVPSDARITEPYWHRAGDAGRYTFDSDAPFGLPYRSSPFAVQVALRFPSGDEITEQLTILHRYEGDGLAGEKRSELLVVPAYAVRISPAIAVVSTSAVRPEREIRVTVINDTRSPGAGEVSLQLPNGWMSTPSSQPLTFARENEAQTVRFLVRTNVSSPSGDHQVTGRFSSASGIFERGFQVIEYPHTRRQHVGQDAAMALKVIDVRMAQRVRVGYVIGVGDEVPAAIEQLGVKPEMIDADDLAWGDLSRFSAIVTGVRAYERRADLRANNRRLLEYVEKGGTLIVQYNKFEFNEAQYGPYPAKVSADRVTDEQAPVTVLAPSDPVFTRPNRIGSAAWSGWVQERGLYFLGDRDPRYQDLVSLTDSFPNNAGEKRGALVSARYGQGRWLYVGLGLWRQLPARVDGAYQLLANLLSLGR